MFFTGMAILVQKFVSLRAERLMLSAARRASHGAESSGAEARQQELDEWCTQLPRNLHATRLFERINDTLHYLKGSRREGLEDHLRYLAELAGTRLHQSYATIRTITWAIPILGFLGTVIGITMAIANVTPEQLDSSLGEVTGGLAVAFDTTALALGMSIVMVFCSFAIEKSEQGVLDDVEQFGIDILLAWFAARETTGAASGAAGITPQQAELWSEQLDGLRTVWSELLSEHAASFRSSLNTEVQHTLQLHRNSSETARDAYASALRSSTASVVEQAERMLTSFETRIAAWQDAMSVSSRSAAQQTEALHDLGATLLRMTEAEERLAGLQKQLNDNLQALQLTDTMEQSANSLTAAVHVLTAKTSLRSAA